MFRFSLSLDNSFLNNLAALYA